MKTINKFKALLPAIQCVYQNLSRTNSKEVVFEIDDTLIFADNRKKPTVNAQIIALLSYLYKSGYKIHLVTARLDDDEMRQFTNEELSKIKIPTDDDKKKTLVSIIKSLSLCPESDRETGVSISKWKASCRNRLKPVALSVGDQWSDLFVLKDETDFDTLDRDYEVDQYPWVVVEPQDNITFLGLKLMDPK